MRQYVRNIGTSRKPVAYQIDVVITHQNYIFDVLKERDHLEDKNIDDRQQFKWIVEKYDLNV